MFVSNPMVISMAILEGKQAFEWKMNHWIWGKLTLFSDKRMCLCRLGLCHDLFGSYIYIYIYVQYILIYDTWLFWCCSARILRYFLVEQQTSCGFSSEAMIRDKWSSVKAKTCRENEVNQEWKSKKWRTSKSPPRGIVRAKSGWG